jgi:cytochrome c2
MRTLFLSLLFSTAAVVALSALSLAQLDNSASETSTVGKPAPVQLRHVAVAPEVAGLAVELMLSGPVAPKLTMLDSPPRVVVDLPNTVAVTPQRHISVGSEGAKAVRVGMNGKVPPTTRIVVELTRPLEYKIVPGSNDNLILRLHTFSANPSGSVQPADQRKEATRSVTEIAALPSAPAQPAGGQPAPTAPDRSVTEAAALPSAPVQPAERQPAPTAPDRSVTEVAASPSAPAQPAQGEPAPTARKPAAGLTRVRPTNDSSANNVSDNSAREQEHQRLGTKSEVAGMTGHAAKAAENYRRYCTGCHGDIGDGNGENAQWLDPRPRNFTLGIFKCRSTPTGTLPTDQDLYDTIGRGLNTSYMPQWLTLTRQERADLVAYVKHFAPRFVKEKPGPPITIPPEPKLTAERIKNGQQVFLKVECWKCHGPEGGANGPSADTLTDDQNRPIKAFNFQEEIRFKCGDTDQDLYRIFMTGLDGTPMPSFADNIKPDDAWDLVFYLRSLQPMHSQEKDLAKQLGLKPINPSAAASSATPQQ